MAPLIDTIDQIDKLDRFEEVPSICDSFEDSVCDLLWSDPMEGNSHFETLFESLLKALMGMQRAIEAWGIILERTS